MLFNSLEFAVFVPAVFFLYWFVCNRHLALQNSLLLVASYVFYGWWDWRFLLLILLSTVVDFAAGIGIEKSATQRKRMMLLSVSLVVNLGLLGFFKYYDFFITSWVELLRSIGITADVRTLNIILPVGISFYTFQTLSYTIDVYRKKISPTTDFIAFATFVAFFPQLVAGPIERASRLLPQFFRKREFTLDKGVDGLRQIGWGLFKKMVIADRCAYYVDESFTHYRQYNGSELAIAVVYFAFQIYCDFSGYSDIAIGTAKLFGFELMVNFRTPYFSRNIAEFWKRWHISLTTWFRDYLYIPLGGSRSSNGRTMVNVLIVFLVSGIWHGANWTFIAWGLLNGLYFLPLLITGAHKRFSDVNNSNSPTLKELPLMLFTFLLTCFGWILFRADSVQHAGHYIARMMGSTFLVVPRQFRGMIPFIIFLVTIEWIGRDKEYAFFTKSVALYKNVLYFLFITLTLVLFGNFGDVEFIYFQF
jgi:alginate O-acetyltransferase complex protein AlgI